MSFQLNKFSFQLQLQYIFRTLFLYLGISVYSDKLCFLLLFPLQAVASWLLESQTYNKLWWLNSNALTVHVLTLFSWNCRSFRMNSPSIKRNLHSLRTVLSTAVSRSPARTGLSPLALSWGLHTTRQQCYYPHRNLTGRTAPYFPFILSIASFP